MYKNNKIILVIFARLNSSRLKKKILKKILNTTLLQKNINIVKKIKFVDKIIIATTTNILDDKIKKIANENKIDCFRGSEKNVLERFHQCINFQKKKYNYTVRYCCDNYLSTEKLIEENIKRAINKGLDLITPGEFALCTKGTSQVVMSLKCLDKIYRKARHKVYLEHVENYCLENWKNFKIDYQIVDKKIYFKNLNFSIDQKKDVTFIEKNNIKSLFQRNIPKINNKINNKIRGKNIYSVTKGKFLKKNRIGYYLLSNFFKPNENINIKKKKLIKNFFLIEDF